MMSEVAPPSLTASATLTGSDSINQMRAAAKTAATKATPAERLTLMREERIEGISLYAVRLPAATRGSGKADTSAINAAGAVQVRRDRRVSVVVPQARPLPRWRWPVCRDPGEPKPLPAPDRPPPRSLEWQTYRSSCLATRTEAAGPSPSPPAPPSRSCAYNHG